MIKIESHVADIRIRLKAASLEHLFSEGMRSLYKVLKPSGKKEKTHVKQSFKLIGDDNTILLIDFMNEVLSYSLIYKYVYEEISKFKNTEDGLFIDLKGYKVKTFVKDVKAVTFHEAEILETETGIFETSIILDI